MRSQSGISRCFWHSVNFVCIPKKWIINYKSNLPALWLFYRILITSSALIPINTDRSAFSLLVFKTASSWLALINILAVCILLKLQYVFDSISTGSSSIHIDHTASIAFSSFTKTTALSFISTKPISSARWRCTEIPLVALI